MEEDCKALGNRIDRRLDRLTSSWGEFMEGIVRPSVVDTFRRMGYRITAEFPNAKSSRNGRNMELDLLLVGQDPDRRDILIALEVKTTLDSKAVDEHVEAMEKLFDFFPDYRGRVALGAISGFRIGKGADVYALRQGLHLFAPGKKVARLVKPRSFVPRVWRADGANGRARQR